LGRNVHTVKERTEALVVAIKEIELTVSADETKYVVMSQDQNARQSQNIKIYNSFFGRVELLKYFRTNLTNENSIQEESKSRLKSGNSCYHQVQNLLFSSQPSLNMNIMTYRSTIFLVLYGCGSH
jgi:hypothetical protein